MASLTIETESLVCLEPSQVAREAGLRYINDGTPGITRKRSGKGWSYYWPDGRLVTEKAHRERINALVIPPAYRDVWICADPRGHLQATGRDEKGRKQYRYHERWNELRNASKFTRVLEFAEHLPGLRGKVDEDLRQRGLSRERVVAAVVRLLDETLIRVGNEEYRVANQSYGLTTFRRRHVSIKGEKLTFSFRGKSGREHQIEICDPRAARVVRRLQELPGQRLFQYLDGDGNPHSVESEDVNQYLREATGCSFSAKDFRTWGGTVEAALALREAGPAESATEAERHIRAAVKRAASVLGNTVATCRKYYVHQEVLSAYRDGELIQALGEIGRKGEGDSKPGLHPEEEAVLQLLRDRLAQPSERLRGAA